MVPTQFKSKLPKALSYPLGAATISDALVNAPHVADLELSFFDAPVWPASEFQRHLRDSLPYKILAASYRPAFRSNYGVGQFRNEEKWELQVYPVLRHLRHKAKQMLTQQGLPTVAEWLRSSNQTGWETRQHTLTFLLILVRPPWWLSVRMVYEKPSLKVTAWRAGRTKGSTGPGPPAGIAVAPA